MINDLKYVFKSCVRSEADIEAWIDEGKVHLRGRGLYTTEDFVVNLKEITVDVHVLIATAALWYEKQSLLMTEGDRDDGLTYDISIINEDAYEIQIVFKMKRKFIITESTETGDINVHECTE